MHFGAEVFAVAGSSSARSATHSKAVGSHTNGFALSPQRAVFWDDSRWAVAPRVKHEYFTDARFDPDRICPPSWHWNQLALLLNSVFLLRSVGVAASWSKSNTEPRLVTRGESARYNSGAS